MRITLVLVFNWLISFPSTAQWNNDPSVNNVIVSSPDGPYNTFSVKDTAGGVIVFFQTYRGNGDYNLYAQKVYAKGGTAWGDSAHPVTICDATKEQSFLNAVADGVGGAFVAWEDFRNGLNTEIYIQHLNAAGKTLWTVNGTRVTQTTAIDNQGTQLCVDGKGGVILSWYNDNYLDTRQIYAQRYNAAGVAQWKQNGVQVCTAAGFRDQHVMISDGAGGAIIVFDDTRDDPKGTVYGGGYTNGNEYAQRLDPNGNFLWGSNGIAVCKAAGNQFVLVDDQYNAFVSDGNGGVIIAFEDLRNDANAGNESIYAQKITASGVTAWAENGIKITDAAGNQRIGGGVSDSAGGMVLAWSNGLDQTVYCQRIKSSGIVAWQTGGIKIAPSSSGTFAPAIVAVGKGLYICCFKKAPGVNTSINAQQVDSSGILQWNANGVEVHDFNAPALTYFSMTQSDNQSVIVNWEEIRTAPANSVPSLYASKLLVNGTLASIDRNDFFSVADGDWNDPATWLNGIVPSATSNVIIRNAITVTSEAFCNTIRVEPPAGKCTIVTGAHLTVTH